jgi:hypothetical protein
VLITMRTPHPWVPLEVLALDGQIVHADLYFLTDEPLNSSAVGAVVGQPSVGSQVPGAPGLQVAFQERMNPALYHDLSTDRNMSWVRSDGWLTYLALDAPSAVVTYDLNVTPDGIMQPMRFGASPTASKATALPGWLPRLPLGAPQLLLPLGLALLLCGAALIWRGRRARATRSLAQ